MEINIEILKASRIKLNQIIVDLPEDQLCKIPQGFNNNILWHLGHCVISQQRLMYLRSNLAMHVPEYFNDFFKIGTSPLNWTIQPEISEVKESLLASVDKLNEDLKNDIFKSYTPIKSSLGFMINNHLDALSYTNFHEAEHSGNIQYLIKILRNQ